MDFNPHRNTSLGFCSYASLLQFFLFLMFSFVLTGLLCFCSVLDVSPCSYSFAILCTISHCFLNSDSVLVVCLVFYVCHTFTVLLFHFAIAISLVFDVFLRSYWFALFSVPLCFCSVLDISLRSYRFALLLVFHTAFLRSPCFLRSPYALLLPVCFSI